MCRTVFPGAFPLTGFLFRLTASDFARGGFRRRVPRGVNPNGGPLSNLPVGLSFCGILLCALPYGSPPRGGFRRRAPHPAF